MAIEDPETSIRDAVPPGETRHIRYPIGETYLGEKLELPITVINGNTTVRGCF